MCSSVTAATPPRPARPRTPSAQAGGSATPIGFDVREPAAVERAFDEVAAGGALDVLVNNAGTSRDGLFPLQDEEAFADVVGTNLLGTVRCCRAAVRQHVAAPRRRHRERRLGGAPSWPAPA